MTKDSVTKRRRYEYIEIGFDIGDLSVVNELGKEGWRIIHVEDVLSPTSEYVYTAFMERELIDDA